MSHMPTIDDVRSYWNRNPLFSHEIDDVGSPAYFDRIDLVKREDVERFAMSYWDFAAYRGRRVLDVGCGPGWLTVQYAKHGANVHSVDLAEKATELTRAHLLHHGLDGVVEVASAENLHLPDASFDLVVASGVLHHTPDVEASFRQCLRVLRPGGIAKITLYRKGILHRPMVFAATRMAMQILGVRHPGADLAQTGDAVEDFVCQYDGAENPIGIAKSDDDWQAMLEICGFAVSSREIHFFPRRFVPAGRWIPSALHRLLDTRLGTMAYFDLTRPT